MFFHVTLYPVLSGYNRGYSGRGRGGNSLVRYGLIKTTAGVGAGLAGLTAGILGPLALAAIGK